MTWFKVDDQFWSHPKTLGLSLAARGLWVSAGAWCACHLTDGVVPAKALPMIAAASPASVQRLAKELEAATLWVRDGDRWRFHDWTDFQRSKTAVESERAVWAERQRKLRQSRRDKDTTDPPSHGNVTPMSRVTPAVTPPESHPGRHANSHRENHS